MMELESITKKDLEMKFLEIPTEIGYNISLIRISDELFDALNYIEKSDCLKFLNFNRNHISRILSKSELNLKIVKDYINNDYFQSFFYLYNIISEDLYSINFTYDFEIIKEIYNKTLEQKHNLTKFILYNIYSKLIK